MAGKALRLRRIFRRDSGRSFIVAVDHGVRFGALKGIEDPRIPVRAAREGGADAVMVTPAIARIVYHELGDMALIARVDGASTIIGPDISYDDIISPVWEAIAVGADAVVAFGYVGVERERHSLRKLSIISSRCLRYGIPLMAEMIPSELSSRHYAKRRGEWSVDVDKLKLAVRVGAELGADMIKTYYTGDTDSFREVVRSSPAPILVLGGPPTDSVESFLSMIGDSIEAGARGAVIGRNVWQHSNPIGMVKALSGIVHGYTSVEEAMKWLREG
ncbi:MAG: 2-amino-3,7-dideoxy-D-threo-hept-6-ulosonate synthase [Nitrososphaerota archaeon]|nr:2-amino-3,7-dideoxy-D-threo-hept-6-ulosonate synthase [Candidatus Bathyarchaeota archaeon]MDW8062270.1 2-amino-3,7-dideoxy-D-threo-hept-6-ulosonate synthase [Nitrososphaerota archaeon]